MYQFEQAHTSKVVQRVQVPKQFQNEDKRYLKDKTSSHQCLTIGSINIQTRITARV